MSRTALLLVVVCLAVVNAVDIGRPLMARNKLDSRMSAHRSRIETARGAAEMEKLEHLRVAAAERETSLADQFAEVRRDSVALSPLLRRSLPPSLRRR